MIDTDASNRVSIDQCVPIPGFNQFITWIAIENNVVVKHEVVKFYADTARYRNCGCIAIPLPSSGQLKEWKDEKIKKILRRRTFHYNLSKFEYIKLYSNELKSVKKLTLTNVCLNKRLVGYILKILPKIEVLELAYSTVDQDLWDILLKYCKNLRWIELTHVTFKNNYEWLLQQYEKLERLELCVDTILRIDEVFQS